MDEQNTPSKRWPMHVVCAALAGLLYLATSALILSIPASEATIQPAPAAGHRPYHSVWPRDYLVWYA